MKGQDRRHLALLAYYFPPLGGAGSLRALSFARHLPDLGWDVTVVTPREGVYGEDASLGAEDLSGVMVARTSSWEPAVLLRHLGLGARTPEIAGEAAGAGGRYVEEVRLGAVGGAVRAAVRRFLYFPDSSRGWIRPAVAAVVERHASAPIDAVLSSSPPVSAHVAAHRASRRLHVPWIADWRDAWTARMPEPPGPGSRAARLEAALLAAADGVASSSDGLGGWLRSRMRRGAPLATVRNGWEPPSAAPRAGPAAEGPFVLHAGTVYGRDQDLAAFFRALRGHGGPGLRARFIGKVQGPAASQAEQAGVVGRVSFEGFRVHEEVVELQRRAAGLVLLGWCGDSEVAATIVPAKTYEYLAAGRPVLALTPPGTELARILEGVRGATVAGFGDEAAIGAWLDGVGRGGLQDSPPPEAAEPYTRRRQAERLAALLDEAVGQGARR